MVEKIKRAKIVEYSIALVISIVILNSFPQTKGFIDKVMEVLSEKVVSSLGGVED